MTVIRVAILGGGGRSGGASAQGWPVGTNSTLSSSNRSATLAGRDQVPVVDGIETSHPSPPGARREVTNSQLTGVLGRTNDRRFCRPLLALSLQDVDF